MHVADTVNETSTNDLLREALDRLRFEQTAGGRLPRDRNRAIAITHLEDAIYRLTDESDD